MTSLKKITRAENWSDERSKNSAAVFMVWVVLSIKPTKKELPSKTRQNVLVPRNKGFSLQETVKKGKEIHTIVCSTPSRRTSGNLLQFRLKRKMLDPGTKPEQEDKHILISSLGNRHLTGPRLSPLLNNTCTSRFALFCKGI